MRFIFYLDTMQGSINARATTIIVKLRAQKLVHTTTHSSQKLFNERLSVVDAMSGLPWDWPPLKSNKASLKYE